MSKQTVAAQNAAKDVTIKARINAKVNLANLFG